MQMITNLPLMLFSSQIPTLEFTDVGTDPVEISISCEGYKVLETAIYPVGNGIYVHDLRQLVEECMKEHNWTYAVMEIEIQNQMWENYVLYCPQNTTQEAASFAESHFLTTLNVKRVPSYWQVNRETLSFLRTAAEEGNSLAVSLTATFLSPDGTSLTLACQYTLPSGYGITTINSSPSQILADFNSYYSGTMEYGWENVMVQSYTISIGNRSFTYYVDNDFTPQQCFIFRNVFNMEEVTYLEAVTVTKTDAERSLATSHGVSMFYDQVDEQEHEVSTAPLSTEEADWLEQLLLSHKVQRMQDGGTLVEVLVTDMTAEVTDSDEEYRRLKFTFRVTKPGATLTAFDNVTTGRRFTAHYTRQYY